MTLYVLDTDHISLQQHAHPGVLQRLGSIREPDIVAVTVITVEEQLRGRLEIIRRYNASSRQVAAYTALYKTVRYFEAWDVLDFSQIAFDNFQELRQQRVRIGAQDLRIAAIVLANNAILVTRNTRDFAQVPELIIQDWSVMPANHP